MRGHQTCLNIKRFTSEKQINHGVGKKTLFFHRGQQEGQINRTTVKCHFCDEISDISSIQAFQDHQLKHELKATAPTRIGLTCAE